MRILLLFGNGRDEDGLYRERKEDIGEMMPMEDQKAAAQFHEMLFEMCLELPLERLHYDIIQFSGSRHNRLDEIVTFLENPLIFPANSTSAERFAFYADMETVMQIVAAELKRPMDWKPPKV